MTGDDKAAGGLERRARELRAGIPWSLNGYHADGPGRAGLDAVNIELAGRGRPPVELLAPAFPFPVPWRVTPGSPLRTHGETMAEYVTDAGLGGWASGPGAGW